MSRVCAFGLCARLFSLWRVLGQLINEALGNQGPSGNEPGGIRTLVYPRHKGFQGVDIASDHLDRKC